MSWNSWAEDKVFSRTPHCRAEGEERLCQQAWRWTVLCAVCVCVWMETCSPDRYRCGRAGQGSQTSGRCYRYDGYRCSFHMLDNRSLKKGRRQCTEVTKSSVYKRSSDTHSLTRGLGGMQALDGWAACVRTQGLPIHTGAAGAGTLRVPVGAFLILHPLQHTCYNEKRAAVIYIYWWAAPVYVCVCVCVCECIITFADRTAELWVNNRVGARDRRALLFTANDIPTL